MAGRDDLTSNHSEAWNSAVKVSLPMKPNIWVVCKTLQEEEGMARAKLHAAMAGGGSPSNSSNPSRTRKRQERATALRTIVEQYKTVPIGQYIGALVAHFNDV